LAERSRNGTEQFRARISKKCFPPPVWYQLTDQNRKPSPRRGGGWERYPKLGVITINGIQNPAAPQVRPRPLHNDLGAQGCSPGRTEGAPPLVSRSSDQLTPSSSGSGSHDGQRSNIGSPPRPPGRNERPYRGPFQPFHEPATQGPNSEPPPTLWWSKFRSK